MPAVAVALLLAVVVGLSGGSGALRDPGTATASEVNGVDLAAVLSRALGDISSDLHTIARAVPSARTASPAATASARDT